MLNIFNLFLVLFTLWILLMFAFANVTWGHAFLGIICCVLISALSFKKRLVNKDSDFSYLAVGFYAYFLKIYLTNVPCAFHYLCKSAFMSNSLNPFVKELTLDEEKEVNIAILIATINMYPGLSAYFEDNILYLDCADGRYYERFYLDKTLTAINNINENNTI